MSLVAGPGPRPGLPFASCSRPALASPALRVHPRQPLIEGSSPAELRPSELRLPFAFTKFPEDPPPQPPSATFTACLAGSTFSEFDAASSPALPGCSARAGGLEPPGPGNYSMRVAARGGRAGGVPLPNLPRGASGLGLLPCPGIEGERGGSGRPGL